MQEEPSEKTFHYLIVGTNNAILRAAIEEAIKQKDQEVDKVFDLTTSEMIALTQKRAQENAEKGSVEFLKSEQNIERCKNWVKTLSFNIAQNLFGKRNPPKLKESLDSFENEGTLPFFVKKGDIKRASNLSWKDFEEMFYVLDINGFVERINNDSMRLVTKTEDLQSNMFDEVTEIVRLAEAKVLNMLEKNIENEEMKTTLKSLKTRFASMKKIM